MERERRERLWLGLLYPVSLKGRRWSRRRTRAEEEEVTARMRPGEPLNPAQWVALRSRLEVDRTVGEFVFCRGIRKRL